MAVIIAAIGPYPDKKIVACKRLASNYCRGEKTRTSDLHVPNVARCQLCYTPSVYSWKSSRP